MHKQNDDMCVDILLKKMNRQKKIKISVEFNKKKGIIIGK